MRTSQGNIEIIAKDLSEIKLRHNDEKLWIQDLCCNLDKERFTFRLTGKIADEEPIIEFRNGQWYAGRYVGRSATRGERCESYLVMKAHSIAGSVRFGECV